MVNDPRMPEARAPRHLGVPPLLKDGLLRWDAGPKCAWKTKSPPQAALRCSRMVGVDELFVGGVRIQTCLQKALCLVDQGTDRHHLRLDGVAKVRGLRLEIVGLLVKETLELVRLCLDAGVRGRALTRQGRHCAVLGHVLGASGQDAGLDHVDEGLHLHTERGGVVLEHDLCARIALLSREDAHVRKQLLRLLRVEGGDCQRSGVQVGQTSLLGLHRPLS
mmetsp:Transcript_65726/g.170683  ORF Transcript_65726/g.170683 Transcript_65726/m.170683 type:complete len:220 (+) Transcript_65726:259-918(+)